MFNYNILFHELIFHNALYSSFPVWWAVTSNMQDIWSTGLLWHNKYTWFLLSCFRWLCIKFLQQVCCQACINQILYLAVTSTFLLHIFSHCGVTYLGISQGTKSLHLCSDLWWRCPAICCWSGWKHWAWKHPCCKNRFSSCCCTYTFTIFTGLGNFSVFILMMW